MADETPVGGAPITNNEETLTTPAGGYTDASANTPDTGTTGQNTTEVATVTTNGNAANSANNDVPASDGAPPAETPAEQKQCPCDISAEKQVSWLAAAGLVLFIVFLVVYGLMHRCPQFSKKDNIASSFFQSMGEIKACLASDDISPDDLCSAIEKLPGKCDDALMEKFQHRIDNIKGASRNIHKRYVDRSLAVLANYTAKSDKYTVAKLVGDNKFRSVFSIIPNDDKSVGYIKTEVLSLDKDVNLYTSASDEYFWTTTDMRWLEIIFWGEFGILVGIWYHICLSRDAGGGGYSTCQYDKDKYWYLLEVVFGPIVVLVVFFLFKQIFQGFMDMGITETDIKSSIYNILGFSFVLGFSMRRCLNLLYMFKNKFFPNVEAVNVAANKQKPTVPPTA